MAHGCSAKSRTIYGSLLTSTTLKGTGVFMSSFQRISSDPNDPTDDTAQESEDALSSGSASFRADENNHEDTTSINGFWKWVPGRLADVEDTTDNQQSASKYCIALVFGQCIAVLASSTNAASYSLSSRHNVNTQFFQLFLMYILLSTHLIWRKPNEGSFMQTNNIDATNTDDIATQHMLPFTNLRLKVPWWIYLIMSILDVFPNYLALFSYRYTSLTSATLLGSLAAPATMLFSKFILARVYKGHHFFGVALCILGGSLTIWSDFDDESNSNSHSYIGDTLAIASALLYGFGDTAGEFFVKNIDRFEYLGMLGVFGTILTGMSFPFLEMGDIIGISKMSTKEESQVCGVMVWYVLSVFLFYVAAAKFLEISDATLLNLSMQATNVWAVLFAVVAYHDFPAVPFYFALVCVAWGVFTYELGFSRRKDCFMPNDRDAVSQSSYDDSNKIDRPTNVNYV